MEPAFKINNFDLIRFFAATQVLILHTVDHLHLDKQLWMVPLSYFPGVPIFYAISGFLISSSYERNDDLKKYFRNRFLRIFPGLWGCLCITVLVATALGFSFFNKAALLWFFAQMAGFIYTPPFLNNFGFGSYNGSLWTICVELQFYIVLPLVYLLMSLVKNNNLVMIILFFVFIVIAVFCKHLLPGMATNQETQIEKMIRYSFIPHFYVFLAGVVMQRFKLYQSRWIRNKGAYWIAGYVMLQILISDLAIPSITIINLLLLSLCILSIAYTRTKLSYKILAGNDISYGIYVYHGLIINILVSNKLFSNSFYILVVVCGAYLLGFMSWTIIERPCLKRKEITLKSI